MEKRGKVYAVILLAIAACAALAGCQSMQKDLLLASADETDYRSLSEIEQIVVILDGVGADAESLAEARGRIAALENTVAGSEFQGMLAAWSGRLYLMEGRNSDALRELRESQSLYPANLQSQILSFRLEREASARLTMIDGSIEIEGQVGELLLERGRVLFDLSRFSESVAAFDAAFVLLAAKPYYEEAYGAFRNKAWELRDLGQGSGSRTVEIAGQGEITWKDLIEITKNETDLLMFITAGRDWPAETLFAQLLERAFIPLTQDVSLSQWPFSKPSSEEVVFRSGAAWFLWHLYAENRASRGLLTRYSSRYANMSGARSPIPDIDISSPFLDSVLGCVETEFISLPDGRNFLPRERVKGTDYLAMLRKLMSAAQG